MKNVNRESPQAVQELVEKNFSALYRTTKNTQIEFLNVSENYTFLVTMGKTRHILRVHRPFYHTPEELNAENIWMHSLKKDTSLTIPKIVAGSDGKLIQSFPSEQEDITYYCSMFTYLEGSLADDLHLQGNDLLKKMVSIGKITAILHNYVVSNDLQLERQEWDFDSMFGESAVWGDWRDCKTLMKDEVELFERVLQLAQRQLSAFGKGFDRFGLIHSDLRFSNIIIHGKQLKIIDFDDCGYSWFLYDLACTMLEFNEGLDELVSAWLTGYQGIRALSDEERAAIPMFILLRRILRFAWFASHTDTEKAKTLDIETYLKKTVELAEKYCRENEGAYGDS